MDYAHRPKQRRRFLETTDIRIDGRCIMISVIEYGENIGTLKNLFLNHEQALNFVIRLIEWSKNEYEHIGLNLWFCTDKKEYIKIEVAA